MPRPTHSLALLAYCAALPLGCSDSDPERAPSSPPASWPSCDDVSPPLPPAPSLPIAAESPRGFQSGELTVVDPSTGLEWQRERVGQAFTPDRPFSDPNNARAADGAAAHCACLALDGKDDWRLPNRIELVSIVDFSRFGPAVDTTAFLGQPAQGDFWTSSHWVNDSIPYAVGMHDGYVTFDGDIQGEVYARCVRGSSLPSSADTTDFEASADVVTDRRTALVWERQALDAQYADGDSAAAYCLGLALPTDAGPWRLPTVKELLTLIREQTNVAVSEDAFPDTGPGNYWASTRFARFDDGTRWVVNFGTGASYGSWDHDGRVRCVH